MAVAGLTGQPIALRHRRPIQQNIGVHDDRRDIGLGAVTGRLNDTFTGPTLALSAGMRRIYTTIQQRIEQGTIRRPGHLRLDPVEVHNELGRRNGGGRVAAHAA